MELRDLEVLAWRLFEELNDAVFVLDAETETIQQANPAAQRLTGFRWRRLRDRRIGEIVFSERPDEDREFLRAIHKTGYFHSRERFLLAREQDSPMPVNVSVSRVHVPSGQLGVVVARDISERRQAEAALREFNSLLETSVAEKTNELLTANRRLRIEIEERRRAEDELKETNEKLADTIKQVQRAQTQAIRREKLNTLEQVAAGIAHDINNSLTAVLAYSQLLKGADADALLHDWSENVHIAALDIAGIVRRLRQFYQGPDTHGIFEPLPFEQLVADVVELTRPKWRDAALRQGKSIEVKFERRARPFVNGDGGELRSVITNLVFNATDAIAGAGDIQIRLDEEDSLAIIEVTDSGIGMDDDVLARCMEPYYSTKLEGSGLGLSVCRGIVRRHGGELTIKSTPGVGTTVRIRLPKADADSSKGDAAGAAVVRGALHGLRILYVDDDNRARTSLVALLRSAGVEVDSADNGETGLALFHAHGYDAVITDMTMPGMNGLEFTASVKNTKPGTPVILLSGWPVEHLPDAVQRPDIVLAKPLAAGELEKSLAQLCRHTQNGGEGANG